MNFEKFTDFGAASRNEVTIRANQGLFISNAIVARFKVDGAQQVVLFIDKTEQKIGIRFLNEAEHEDDARSISKEKSGISVNIGSILRYFGVNKLNEKEVVPIKQFEEMLVFSIKNLVDKFSNNV